MLAGLDAERAEGLHLGGAEDFHRVCQGDCTVISDEVDDGQVGMNANGWPSARFESSPLSL